MWHAWCLFGVLELSWDPTKHKIGHFEVQAWTFIRFYRLRDPILRIVYVRTKKVYSSCLFPGFFFWWFLGLSPDVWEWKTKRLAQKELQKSTFEEVRFVMVPGFIFYGFGWHWFQFWCFLLIWKPAWTLMIFRVILGSAQIESIHSDPIRGASNHFL